MGRVRVREREREREGEDKGREEKRREEKRREEKRREEKRREEKKKLKKRKLQKKEDPGARKSRKVAQHCVFFQWFVAPEGGRRKGLCTLPKVSKTWGLCSISKNDGRRGAFEEDLQRCIFRGRRSTRDMFIRVVRRSGRWFPDRGCILEHQISRFAEMILRDRCSTSYDLASLFRGRRSTLDRWSGKIAKRIGTRPSAQLLSTQLSIFEESLAELLRFWCCQVQKLRKSRRIASFWMKFQNWRSLAEFLVVEACR